MAKVDRKDKSANAGEKHSLSSFDKKRGAIASFNARTNKNKKYHVARVQRKDENIVSGTIVASKGKSAELSDNEVKSAKADAPKAFQPSAERTDSRSSHSENKPESAVSEHNGITPETAQRMKRATFLDQQNKANIKINTARADFSETAHSHEITEDKNSVPVSFANDSGEKKPYEHKYVSQTSDSIIPEQKKAITPEMALRMKRRLLSNRNTMRL